MSSEINRSQITDIIHDYKDICNQIKELEHEKNKYNKILRLLMDRHQVNEMRTNKYVVQKRCMTRRPD